MSYLFDWNNLSKRVEQFTENFINDIFFQTFIFEVRFIHLYKMKWVCGWVVVLQIVVAVNSQQQLNRTARQCKIIFRT